MSGIRIMPGDCRDVLGTLPAASVQCVVTSPPYYGLRDYGTAQWEGGDAGCDHSGRKNHGHSADVGERNADGNAFRNSGRYVNQGDATGRVCSCGATRIDRQIGLEATPDEYLATMVAVFREVRRVLRDDGTCWVNMGDSYWNGGGEKRDGGHGFVDGGKTKLEAARGTLLQAKCSAPGYKPKDLLMMPARLALALQADGWWLRSDIIWHKPNPMPESVTDRPTSAHEHVFLLTKRATYYYDADAVREEAEYGRREWSNANGVLRRAGGSPGNTPSATVSGGDPSSGRNLRNVWTLATHAYSAAHFATFPPALAERCIKAGTSDRGCCGQCGAPWGRQTERTAMVIDRSERTHSMGRTRSSGTMLEPPTATTTGWAPGCRCDAPVVPCTVLDPFAGAGTTLLVADRLQRNAIGIELNPAYTELAMARCVADAPLFTSWPPAEDPADTHMADLFAGHGT